MDTGSILFFGMIGLYMIGGPFVLLAIYVFLDRYSQSSTDHPGRRPVKKDNHSKKPSFWTADDVRKMLTIEENLKNDVC